MSGENAEIVRRAVEAWQRDDFEGFLSLIDPEMERHTALERLVEGVASVYRGFEGMRECWTVYRTELDDFQVETQELRDLAMTAFFIFATSGGAAPRARSRLSRRWVPSSRFATARSCDRWTTSATRKPSKPSGYGRRRWRGRTSK